MAYSAYPMDQLSRKLFDLYEVKARNAPLYGGARRRRRPVGRSLSGGRRRLVPSRLASMMMRGRSLSGGRRRLAHRRVVRRRRPVGRSLSGGRSMYGMGRSGGSGRRLSAYQVFVKRFAAANRGRLRGPSMIVRAAAAWRARR
jgi:hypothetical protein